MESIDNQFESLSELSFDADKLPEGNSLRVVEVALDTIAETKRQYALIVKMPRPKVSTEVSRNAYSRFMNLDKDIERVRDITGVRVLKDHTVIFERCFRAHIITNQELRSLIRLVFAPLISTMRPQPALCWTRFQQLATRLNEAQLIYAREEVELLFARHEPVLEHFKETIEERDDVYWQVHGFEEAVDQEFQRLHLRFNDVSRQELHEEFTGYLSDMLNELLLIEPNKAHTVKLMNAMQEQIFTRVQKLGHKAFEVLDSSVMQFTQANRGLLEQFRLSKCSVYEHMMTGLAPAIRARLLYRKIADCVTDQRVLGMVKGDPRCKKMYNDFRKLNASLRATQKRCDRMEVRVYDHTHLARDRIQREMRELWKTYQAEFFDDLRGDDKEFLDLIVLVCDCASLKGRLKEIECRPVSPYQQLQLEFVREKMLKQRARLSATIKALAEDSDPKTLHYRRSLLKEWDRLEKELPAELRHEIVSRRFKRERRSALRSIEKQCRRYRNNPAIQMHNGEVLRQRRPAYVAAQGVTFSEAHERRLLLWESL